MTKVDGRLMDYIRRCDYHVAGTKTNGKVRAMIVEPVKGKKSRRDEMIRTLKANGVAATRVKGSDVAVAIKL